MRAVAFVVVFLAALVWSGCGNDGAEGACSSVRPASDASSGASEVDLAYVLRVAGGTSASALVEVRSGPQTLEDVASAYELRPDVIRECGFVAAWQAFFQGSAARPHNALAISFAEPAGAKLFVRILRLRFETYGDDGIRPIDAGAFGREALAYSVPSSDTEEGRLYIWPVGRLVLEVYAPAESARAFGEQIEQRARELD